MNNSSTQSPLSADQILTYFEVVDPVITSVLKQMPLKIYQPLLDHNQYFAALCRTIVGQQLSGKAADTIHGRFLELVDNEPTPDKIITLEGQQLRDKGLSWSKIKYMKDLAEKTKSGELDLAALPTLEDQAVIEALVKVKGIGYWTAEMFLLFTLGRTNIFSYGDLGLLRGLQKLYGVGEKPDPQQIAAIIDTWSPYKSYGSLALWYSLDNR
jgi:DNA-3-methyladenine glycosylase II